MTSLKLKLLAPRGRGTEQAGNCGYFAASKERQKSSISQKIVTISMQNSDRDGFGDQTVDPIYHIPQEFCFLFRRTHVNIFQNFARWSTRALRELAASNLSVRKTFLQTGLQSASNSDRITSH